jgi:hypothetical protein
MAIDWTTYVGDIGKPMRGTLRNPDDTARDLTGKTVRLRLRSPGAATRKVDVAVTVLSPATAGRIEWVPLAAHVDTEGSLEGGLVEDLGGAGQATTRVTVHIKAAV